MRKILLVIFLLSIITCISSPKHILAQYNPPPGCSVSLYGCTSGYVYCPGTLFCCPDLSYCTTVTPYITPPAGGIQPTPCKQGEPGEGIQTALGCIPTKDTTQFVGWLLKFAIGIGGGIAFLLMIFGGFKIITSSGNPEAVKAGQELITSALMGLIFIIFSVFLLQLIGVKILQIPGFGTP